jgi:NADH-quinone oxidoreductase subunit L
MNPLVQPWIILFAPLAAAAAILFFGKYSRLLSSGLAIAAAALGCVLSWNLFLQGTSAESTLFYWLNFPPVLQVPVGFIIDHLSRVMLVVVTTIATLVFIYSLGYMKHEEGYSRYFAGLSLFLFSMLGIVLASNFVMLFIFWELVGLSSYVLIGHYYPRAAAADAAKQAFLCNRIGDFGLMAGIILLWSMSGTVLFRGLELAEGNLEGYGWIFTLACILVFFGAVGKSAQMPLHVWLPNSMEGPTPVSSLLHAATMVAAGVYMLARFFPVLYNSPGACQVIAWVGGVTAICSALMATQQNNIKRILAYSTISQLAYMMIGIGVATNYQVAMFHLFTHAFFKCLLFLCAGSVIVAMHHEQDIWKMGGLRGKQPVTFLCLVFGMLALSGCPFFSGYYSKDLIIEWAWASNPWLGLIAALTAGLTAFYMFRLCVVVFFGKPRSEAAEHARETPVVMTGPLVLLAIPSLCAGWPLVQRNFFSLPEAPSVPGYLHVFLLALFFLSAAGAIALYRGAEKDPVFIPFFANRFYIDERYDWLVKNVQDAGSWVLAWLDRWVVDLLVVQLPARLAYGMGFVLRFLQIGNTQAYAFFFGAGVVLLIYFLLFK